MNYDQFLSIYNSGPEATYRLLFSTMETNIKLSAHLSQLEERVKELEDRLNKNSSNSSKPPSSDEFVKPKSQRKKSGKNPGGQKGRKGKTLKMSDNPDQVVTHQVISCECCGFRLEEVQPERIEKRQEYDIPPQKMIVIEHHSERKKCPSCSHQNSAPFPPGIKLPVQYGPLLKSMLVYLNQYQLIPYKRTVELIEDVYGHKLSEGMLFNSINSTYEALQPVEEQTIELLLNTPVNHVDETGLRIEGKLQWLHVLCNDKLTHYDCHGKRGMKALEDIGILTRYAGTIIHDYWKPYFKLSCRHGLCNAHHLRELTGITELTGQAWPEELSNLLLEIKETLLEHQRKGIQLSKDELAAFSERYDLIIEKGYLENPPPKESPLKKRGRKKQSKARNLLNRLSEHKGDALAFMYDDRISFDNNQAERDIRMVKVKQKISGVFRSEQGAKMFCRIRSYISMVKKNSLPVLDAINGALQGCPYIPQA